VPDFTVTISGHPNSLRPNISGVDGTNATRSWTHHAFLPETSLLARAWVYHSKGADGRL